MKFLIALFTLACAKISYSQDSIFGEYQLQSSMPDYIKSGTTLRLNCDYTYYRADSISKDKGNWKLKENGVFILSIDTMSANGRTEKHRVKVYYKITNGQLKLDERHYSKKAFKNDIKASNESFRINNLPFRSKFSKWAYEKWRRSTMSLYFEKKKSLICQ